MTTPLLSLLLLVAADPACVAVEGAHILARDVAGVEAAFAALPPEERLGFAPAPGAVRHWTAAELTRLARRHGIEATPSRGVCFGYTAAPPGEEEVMAAMRESLPDAQIEIVELSRYKAPRGRIEFPRRGLTAAGDVWMWRGTVRYGERRSVPVWARVKIALDVAKGETVEVVVSSGAARLKFDAVAETSGLSGADVIVKNPANGRRFRARVEGKRKVAVWPAS